MNGLIFRIFAANYQSSWRARSPLTSHLTNILGLDVEVLERHELLSFILNAFHPITRQDAEGSSKTFMAVKDTSTAKELFNTVTKRTLKRINHLLFLIAAKKT